MDGVLGDPHYSDPDDVTHATAIKQWDAAKYPGGKDERVRSALNHFSNKWDEMSRDASYSADERRHYRHASNAATTAMLAKSAPATYPSGRPKLTDDEAVEAFTEGLRHLCAERASGHCPDWATGKPLLAL